MKTLRFVHVLVVLFISSCFCQNQLDQTIGSRTGGTNVPIASYGSVAQSFTTVATSISKVTAWISATASITLQLKDGYNGNVLGSATVTINGNQGGVDFVFTSPVTVTPGNTYFAYVSTNFQSNWLSDSSSTYAGGLAWLNGQSSASDLWMDVYGTVPDQTCVGVDAFSGSQGSCGNTPVEFNILQPTSDLLLCNLDLVGRTVADPNAVFDFAIYESNSNNVVSTYTKVSSVVRAGSGGNGILNNIVNPTPLRPDRYYLFGWSCTNCAVGALGFYTCGGSFNHPNFTWAGSKYGFSGISLPASFNPSSIQDDGSLRLYYKIYTKPYQVTPTTGDSNFLITTSPMTTSPLTTSVLTTGFVQGTVTEDVRVLGLSGGGLLISYFPGGVAQSFVTRANAITRISIWCYTYSDTMTVNLRDNWNGNSLGSATVTTGQGGNVQVTFVFPTPVAVVPGQSYWIQVTCVGSSSWNAFYNPAPYVDGSAWSQNNPSTQYDLFFLTEGYLPDPNPAYAQCSAKTPNVGGGGGCGNTPTEVNIYKPLAPLTLCMTDIIMKELATTTANLEFVFYESSDNDINSNYNAISIFSRTASSGNIVLRNITSPSYVLRTDRYYAIGFSCSVTACFGQYQCGGGFDSTEISLQRTLYNFGPTSFGATFNFGSLQDSGGLRNYLRFFFAPAPPLTTAPVFTSAGLTSASLTSSPATSGSLSTGHITSGLSVTTGSAVPVTTGVPIVTTESPLVSTGSPVPVTTGVAPVTTGVVAPAVTTGVAANSITSGVAPAVTSGVNNGGSAAITTGSALNIQSPSDEGNGNKVAIGAGVGGGIAAIIIVAIIVIAFILLGRKKQNQRKPEIEGMSASVDLEKTGGVSNVGTPNSIPMLKNIEIKRKLGGGSFGEVFLGNWNGTKVALKKLKDKDQFEEFMKEAGTLSQVVHPNCVQFLGIYTENGDQYMVTEYLPKGALRTTLLAKKDKVTVVDLLTMSIGAAKGLAYLESKNILHRDVALRNLLAAKIDGEYTAKVSDFGLSRSTSSGEYQMKAETKVPIKWTAPEVLKGSRVTIKNDVWAFGVTMWEIFSFGQEPYAWMSNKEAFIEIPKGERLPKPEGCPEEVFKVMNKCWEAKGEDRPSFIELVKELKAVRKSLLKLHPELRKSELSPNGEHQVTQTNTNDPSRTPTGTPGNTNPSTIGSAYTSIPGRDEEETKKPLVQVRSGSRRPLGQSETYEKTPKNTLDSDSD